MDRIHDIKLLDRQLSNGAGKFGLLVWDWFYDGGIRSSWHRHCGFCEIAVCCHGGARHEDDAGGIVLSPGDVLFLPPDSEHRYTDIQTFRHFNIIFGAEYLPFLVSGGVPLDRVCREFFPAGGGAVRRTLAPEHLSSLIEMLEELRQEMIGGRADRDGVLFAGVCRVLIFLQRHCTEQCGTSGGHAYQIGRAVQYMERSARSGFSVSAAAAYAGMSESNFRSHFLKLMGMTPMEYAQKLRLRLALLALTSNLSVSEAAAQGGFSDVSYFCRLFKMRCGITPLKFRRAVLSGEINPAKFLE